jgi:hypothetical protein
MRQRKKVQALLSRRLASKMNYKSRAYVDLHVIDAIDNASLKRWGFEADALRTALEDTAVNIVPHTASDITTLIEAINDVRTYRRSYVDPRQAVPYIHISCHGNRTGLVVGESEQMSWRAFSEALLPLLETTDYHLALTLSSCWGYRGGELAYVMSEKYRKRRPYYSLVGPIKTEKIPELFAAFAEFYRQLLAKYRKLKTAVEFANKVSRAKLDFTKGSRVRYD